MKVCPRCYWENENGDQRCMQCFTELPKRATHRGKPTGDGFNLQAKQVAETETNPPPREEGVPEMTELATRPARDTARGLLVLAVLIILCISAGVFALRAAAPKAANNPKQAAQVFLDALFERSPDEYRGMLTTASRSRAVGAEMLLGNEVFTASRLGKNTQAQVGSLADDSETVKVFRYTLETDLFQEGGEAHAVYDDLELVMRLEERSWRVDLTLTAARRAYKTGRGAEPTPADADFVPQTQTE